jgi:hypothetical protein
MTPLWRKSSYSGGNNQCLEVGSTDSRVLVRDTKDREGGTLSFDVSDWSAFITSVH